MPLPCGTTRRVAFFVLAVHARAVAIDNMRPLAASLTEAGIATWNVEYRRLGNDGGGWPGTFQDVSRAADFVFIDPESAVWPQVLAAVRRLVAKPE